MYNNRDNNRGGNRYDRRPSQYDRQPNRPAPLPEGFALYYIAALCPTDVNAQVDVYKQYMQDKYGSRAAQKSPAHLTIVPPFKAEENMEKQLNDFVTTYNIGVVPFDIRLNGFSHFGNRVISVDVAPNETLIHLEQEVNTQFTEQFPAIIFRTKPEFNPHVTIATRDIPEHKFDEAWDYFQQQNIDTTFICNGLSVLKLVRGVWQTI